MDITSRSVRRELRSRIINLSFSEFPLKLAEKYTARYEKEPTAENREEALLFVAMLEESKQKPFEDRISWVGLEAVTRSEKNIFEMNESRTALHFKLEGNEEYQVVLYTLSGLQVKQSEVSAVSSSLEIGDLLKMEFDRALLWVSLTIRHFSGGSSLVLTPPRFLCVSWSYFSFLIVSLQVSKQIES